MSKVIVFLDIDGVYVPDGEDIHHNPQFHPRCLKALKSILTAVPNVRIVFSTTWRLPRHVNRLHSQWTEHGFSENLAIDATPDTRQYPSVSPLYRRGLEIKAWLDSHPEVQNWLVIDDEKLAIETVIDPGRCVFTNPARGLTMDDAERAVKILQM